MPKNKRIRVYLLIIGGVYVSAVIKITYPTENQIVHPGGLSIRGTGPAGKKIHVSLREYEWLHACWDIVIGNDEAWDASGAIVKNGNWNIDVVLIADDSPPVREQVSFHVKP
jgi:hypothetical protein